MEQFFNIIMPLLDIIVGVALLLISLLVFYYIIVETKKMVKNMALDIYFYFNPEKGAKYFDNKNKMHEYLYKKLMEDISKLDDIIEKR